MTRTEGGARKSLATHHEAIRSLHLRQLFADDPGRGERLTCEAVGLYLDYSKNRVTDQTLALLDDVSVRVERRRHRPGRTLVGLDPAETLFVVSSHAGDARQANRPA